MPGARSLAVISLGCPKNLVDTEHFLGRLHRAGFKLTPNLPEAEVIIVNTCAFISEATSESIETLLEAARFKQEGNCRLLVAAGCLPQKERRNLMTLLPEIDMAVGVHAYGRLPELIELSLRKRLRLTAFPPPRNVPCLPGERFLTRPPYSVYVKISEGCDNRCAYCVIPKLRGPHRSRPLDSILEEVSFLSGKGAREINIVAQDTTLYGSDMGDRSLLPLLLRKVSEVEGIEWVRLLYAHPAHLHAETIETIALHPGICSYVDISLQHVNDRILKNMGRPYGKKQVVDLFEQLGKYDLALRTTFIVGFPGEGEREFQELLNFMEDYPIDRVGAFAYSPEKGTRAFSLKGHLDPKVKKARWKQLMEKQQKISENLNRRFLGEALMVLTEGKTIKNGIEYYLGRTRYQAPEIDGSVLFTSNCETPPGRMVKVRIKDCGPYDLFGEEIPAAD